MIEIKTNLRKWGNSLGIVVPLSKTGKEKIKEGKEVTILLTKTKEGNVLEETFGLLKKWKKPTQRIMKEVDKELWENG